MMTDDEVKAIAERIDADEDYDMDDDEETDNRFAQACVDRKRLLDEVQRLRRQQRPLDRAEEEAFAKAAIAVDDVSRIEVSTLCWIEKPVGAKFWVVYVWEQSAGRFQKLARKYVEPWDSLRTFRYERDEALAAARAWTAEHPETL